MQENESLLSLRKFVAPEFVFGMDGRMMAGRYARNLGARKVMLVTDPGVMAAGWAGQVRDTIESEGIACATFSQVTPNPKADEVMAGSEFYLQEKCDVIVAVGGGSPMDCAKGIGIASSNRRPILSFEGVDEVPIPGPPLVCVPTTAGTSADVSQFAIITDTARQVKIAIVSKTMVPDAALIDPVTTTTMDARLTAATGMDALCHAFESYVSTAQSPLTDVHALEAARLVWANLLPAIRRPDDLVIRGRMMLGSLHAGLAFSNASLGSTHAMAHSIGGLTDFPHGESNAILLARVVEYNYDTTPDRYQRLGRAIGLEQTDKDSLVNEIDRLRRACGLGASLRDLGLKPSLIPKLAQTALRDVCTVTNPRRPTQRDYEALYEKAF